MFNGVKISDMESSLMTKQDPSKENGLKYTIPEIKSLIKNARNSDSNGDGILNLNGSEMKEFLNKFSGVAYNGDFFIRRSGAQTMIYDALTPYINDPWVKISYGAGKVEDHPSLLFTAADRAFDEVNLEKFEQEFFEMKTKAPDKSSLVPRYLARIERIADKNYDEAMKIGSFLLEEAMKDGEINQAMHALLFNNFNNDIAFDLFKKAVDEMGADPNSRNAENETPRFRILTYRHNEESRQQFIKYLDSKGVNK